MITWRYIPLSVNNAAMNMAIDEAILQARVADKVPNTLSFTQAPSSLLSAATKPREQVT
jgi:lipoate-protein ligase A